MPGLRFVTNARGDTILHDAAIYGDPEMLSALQKIGFSIYQANEDGWTPLFSAAYAGELKNHECLITEFGGLNFLCPKLFLASLVNLLIFLGFPGSIFFVSEFLFFSFFLDLFPFLALFLLLFLYLLGPTFFFRS